MYRKQLLIGQVDWLIGYIRTKNYVLDLTTDHTLLNILVRLLPDLPDLRTPRPLKEPYNTFCDAFINLGMMCIRNCVLYHDNKILVCMTQYVDWKIYQLHSNDSSGFCYPKFFLYSS